MVRPRGHFDLTYDALNKLDLDKYTRLAARIMRRPMALINLLDANNQYIMSEFGLPGLRDGLMNRCDSFCNHTAKLDAGEFCVVPNALTEPTVSDLPVVLGEPFIRYYVGTPLFAAGETIGALCVLDTHPGAEPTADEKEALLDLAQCVLTELKLRVDSDAALSAKRDFLTSMSHEIRNPLHGISMSVETFQSSQTALSAAEKSSLQVMRHCIGTLDEILDNLLTFVQFSADEAQAESEERVRSPVDIIESLEHSLDSVWHGANLGRPADDVAIVVATGVDILHESFSVYRGEFARLVLALVSNAFKNTASGRVSVSLSSQPDERATHRRVTLTVRDTGCGMEPSILDQVFLPFYQQDAKMPGTGLGLYIAQRLVHASDGHIRIESRPNVGTVVTAELRLELAVYGTTNSSALDSPSTLRGVRYCLGPLGAYRDSLEQLCQNFGMRQVPPIEAEVILTEDVDLPTLPAGHTTLRVLITTSLRKSLADQASSHVEEIIVPIGPRKLSRAILAALRTRPIPATTAATPSIATLSLDDDSKVHEDQANRVVDEPRTEAAAQKEVVITERVKGRCLVVDDNQVNVKILSTFLNRLGLTCDAAYDGKEAVEAVKQSQSRHYDFIMMDLNMPKMSGIDASKEILKFQAEQKMPQSTIAAVSGCSDAEAEFAMSCGIQHFFKKPVNLQSMSHFVRQRVKPERSKIST